MSFDRIERIEVGSIRVEPEFHNSSPGNVRIGTTHLSGLIRHGAVVVEGADVHDLLTALKTAIDCGWVKGPKVSILDDVLYDICAKAFGVSREKAKEAILSAALGKDPPSLDPTRGAVDIPASSVGWDPYGDGT